MLKHSLLVGLFFLINISKIEACDACGGSMSQIYWGILPNNQLHYVGLWWQHQQYESNLYNLEPSENARSEEWFNTVEIRTKINVRPRIQVLAILPYQYHIRNRAGIPSSINGMGDLSVLGSYLLLQTQDSSLSNIQHQMRIGAGVKAPTGNFSSTQASDYLNPNFQLGSGSWDAIFNISYSGRSSKLGWSADVTYKHNSKNENDYKFGNRFNSAVNLFYTHSTKNIDIIPTLGFLVEQADWDVQENYYRTNTGGHAWFGSAGVETYFKRYNFGLNYNYPIQVEWANGNLVPGARWAFHLNLFL